jgi:ankyrin repeat protein
MVKYEYTPIDLDGPAIRLVRLLKGRYYDDIRCELFDAFLQDGEDIIPYEALSYTWGATNFLARITTDGDEMHVTKNLHTALKHLRSKDTDRILWVDAICIDQSNKRERGHQVNQMSRIYKEAEQVVIWLGEATDKTDRVMQSMRLLQERVINIGGDWRQLAEHWMSDTQFAQLTNTYTNWNTEKLALQDGLKLLLSRSWFQRIWVLQEVANARVAVVVCGEKSVSARIFALVPPIVGLCPDAHCQAVLDIMPGMSRKRSWWSQNRDLHTLLTKFSNSEASDPRDKIYALLGMSSDACDGQVFCADYEKKLEQVIHDTYVFLLSCTEMDPSLANFSPYSLSALLQSMEYVHIEKMKQSIENRNEKMVAKLLESGKIDVNYEDVDGRILLSWAAERGHEDIVKILLETGESKLDHVDYYGRSPLSWAAEGGHDNIVDLLLSYKVVADFANNTDNDGRTPFLRAVERGHQNVTKLLMTKMTTFEVAITRDRNGQLPLFLAAEKGHEGIVKLLRDSYDPYIKTADYTGRTLFSHAAGQGLEIIVRLLLEELGASISDTRDDKERTPISWAAEKGHESVVRLMLEKCGRSIIESVDETGRSAVSYAAEGGHEAVVSLFLKNCGASIAESVDETGRNAVSYAAEWGHKAVVGLLLEKCGRGIARNLNDDGRSPLSFASERGHADVVKMLLTNGRYAIDGEVPKARKSLSWMAKKGRRLGVKLLLGYGEAYFSQDLDKNGRTSLSWAAEGGHAGVVKILLLSRRYDVESKDGEGRTTLSRAAEGGHEGVVKILIDGGCNIDSKDGKGRTPLSWAAEGGHESVVRTLLQNTSIRRDIDNLGLTSLSWAAGEGHEGVVEILLLEGGYDVNTKDLSGRTPLSWAKLNNHKGVVDLLLSK